MEEEARESARRGAADYRTSDNETGVGVSREAASASGELPRVARMPGETLSALQPALPLDLGDETPPGAGAGEVVVRPERNLEKWPIWEPSNSRHRMRARTLQREIRLPDGAVATARVEVGYTNNGALTTEDQKTCYALFRIWEEADKPQGRVFFTRQQLARVLQKSWGSKTNKAITESLMRLRFTPFVWERSYFDSARQETVERIDTFNILSELHLVRRTSGETILAEGSYFSFNDRILANLTAGFTRPVYLDTILEFKSEIAQILYTHLDLVMADKTAYERRSRELFEDLGIDGATYRYPSKRAQVLEPALRELTDVPVPHGLLTVTLERTADRQDFKIVARKAPLPRGRRRPGSAPAVALTDPIKELPAPVVTQVINAPPEPKKRVAAGTTGGKAGRSSKTGRGGQAELPAMAPVWPGEASDGTTPTSVPPPDADAARKPVSVRATAAEAGAGRQRAERQELEAAAKAQVRFFYQVFHQAGETARPTARELALARDHLARLGAEGAQYLVQFARREAKKTDFSIQNYAGIAQYEGRALAEQEANNRQRREALDQRSRQAHRQRHEGAYLAYLRAALAALDAVPTHDFAPFLEEEDRGREAMRGGKPEEELGDAARRRLASFDDPERRLQRFREFLKERHDANERVADVLSFWEWDERHNPERLAP